MEYNVTCQNLTGKKSLNKNQKRKEKKLNFFWQLWISSQPVT